MSQNPEKLGINVLKPRDEDNVTLAILRQENVWICNTGVSLHVTWSNNGGKTFETQ